VRLTGGEFKGRTLDTPPKGIPGVRPSMDSVREAVFSVLFPFVEWPQASVLDLYACTGAYGLEAFSRGAKFVQFVENNSRCLNVLSANIEKIGVQACSKVSKLSVLKFLKTNTNQFSTVFADPPYGDLSVFDFFMLILGADALLPNAVVIFELAAHDLESELERCNNLFSDKFNLLKVGRYSSTGIIVARVLEN